MIVVMKKGASQADIDHMNDAQAGGQPFGETGCMLECVCGAGASVYGDQDS